MDSKFKRVMDWGTPRLVTKNRQLNMTGKQIESRGMILGMANIRTGNIQNVKAAPKQEFAQTSISSFRKKMMEEEKQSEQMHQDKDKEESEGPERRISYGLLPQPEEKMRSASIADVGIKSDIKDELASLFS